MKTLKQMQITTVYLPVLLEQGLATLITMLGTMLVTSLGSAAVSGVGLVDSMNFLFMNIFVAIATGITAVISHAVGRNEPETAIKTAEQSISLAFYVSIAMGVILVVFRKEILFILFNGAEDAVLEAAAEYLFYTASSLPLLAIFNVVSGIRRAVADNFSPLFGSFVANIVYIAVSLVCIHCLKTGVSGVGFGLLVSRFVSVVVVIFILIKKPNVIKIKKIPFRLNKNVLAPMLNIAIPSSLDTLAFNGGKIVVQVFMAGMGTPALAANAICNSLANFLQLPARTLQITCVPLTGVAFGSKDMKRTRRVMISQTVGAMISEVFMSILFFIFFIPLVNLFTYDDEVIEICKSLMYLLFITVPIFWPSSFILPNAIRATGDASFTMKISMISMIFCRIFGSWLFGVYFDMNMFGVWLAMIIDWFFRSLFYVPRMLSDKWYDPDCKK